MPVQIQYGDGVSVLLPVKATRVLVYCTYVPVPADGKKFPNIWHLSICGEDQSITIDIFPRNNRARKCVLVLNADTPSLHTNDDIGPSISLPIQKSCSLQGVVNAIIEKGRGRYLFAAYGRGARNWIRTVVGDLERQEFLPDRSWETVDLTLMDVWYSATHKAWCEVVCGNFYPIEAESDPE